MENKLDRVRDILFKDFENRFQHQIESLEDKVDTLFLDIKKQMSDFQNHIQDKFKVATDVYDRKIPKNQETPGLRELQKELERQKKWFKREIISLSEKMQSADAHIENNLNIIRSTVNQELSSFKNTIFVDNKKLETALREYTKTEIGSKINAMKQDLMLEQNKALKRLETRLEKHQVEIQNLKNNQVNL